MKYKILLIFFTLILFSCQNKKDYKIAQDTGFENKYERGPITVWIKTDKKEITIAQRLKLSIEALLAEDYSLEFPEYAEKLLNFGIVDFRTELPKLEKNQKVFYKKYFILEPFLSGEYIIPPLKIVFWKNDNPEKKYELETEEIKINVKSLLPENKTNLYIKDITPTLVPENNSIIFIIIYLFIIILIISGGYLYYTKFIKKTNIAENIIKLTPHEIAYESLKKLISMQLIEKNEIKKFYFIISDILRYYIEDRFNIHAPELTTEEFLNLIKNNNIFDYTQKSILKRFLTNCDLVKFANYNPTEQEIQEIFDTLKEFIENTKDENILIPIDEEHNPDKVFADV